MTLPAQIRKGAAAPHFVAFISGMPWAVATSQAVIDALAADTVTRRHLFGAAREYVAPDSCPGERIPILPGLQPPGKQSVKLDQDQAWVDVGPFDLVYIGNRDGVRSWPADVGVTNARAASLRGLEGVHAIADPRYSATVASGRLTRSVMAPATAEAAETIYLDTVASADLLTRIAAYQAAGEVCWLWCGTEALAAYAVGAAVGDETPVDVRRGILRTRPHTHLVADFDSGGSIITDAPLGGVAHRPVALYAIALDAAGAVEDWFRIRHGVVSPTVTTSRGKTTIRCNGWTDTLKAALPERGAVANLRGISISRPLDATDQLAAIKLRRTVGGVATDYPVWLCEPGTTIFFEDYDAFCQALNTELTNCYSAVGPTITGNVVLPVPITCDHDGLHADDSPINTLWECTGDIAVCLALGIWYLTDATMWKAFIRAHEQENMSADHWLMMRRTDGGPWLTAWQDLCYNPMVYSQDKFRSRYLVMPSHADWAGASPFDVYNWPPSENRLHLAWSKTVTDYGAGDRLTIGDTSISMELNTESDVFTPAQFMFTVDSVDAPTNAILLDIAPDGYSCEYLNNAAAVRKVVGGTPTVHARSSIFAFIPAVHGSADVFPIQYSTTSESDSFRQILEDLLGDLTDASLVQTAYRFDSIPDALDRVITIGAVNYYDQTSSIDWTTLEDHIHPLPIGFTHTYSLKLGTTGDDITPFTILRAAALLHGAAPSWQADIAARTERMFFRPAAIINVTAAWMEGRTITESELLGTDDKEDHAILPAYQRAKVSANHDGNAYKMNVNVVDENAYGVTGNRGKTLTIADRTSQIALGENNDTQVQAFLAVHNYVMAAAIHPRSLPQPTISTSSSSRRWFDLGVGCELLITDRAVHDPFTGDLRLVERPCLITSTTRDLGSDDSAIDVDLIIAAESTYGWTPNLYVAANDSVVTGADTIEITPQARYFTHPTEFRTDLSWFDCYIYSLSLGQLVDRDCACGDYSVKAITRNVKAPTVFTGLTIEDVDVTAGTATLRGAGLGVAWGAAGCTLPWIIRFSPWNHAGLQPCQRYFCCGSNANSELVDSAAAVTPAHRWA